MSKKNKKKNAQYSGFDIFGFNNPIPKEGDLRFFQKIVEKRVEKWWGWDYRDLGSSPKTLQRFDGKDWKDIPFEREYIEI